MSDIRKVLILDHRDIKTLAKHKYAELAYTTDAMLDLWNEIVDQILEQQLYIGSYIGVYKQAHTGPRCGMAPEPKTHYIYFPVPYI